MKEILIYEMGEEKMIAEVPVEVTNPEAIVALGLCKDHGKEIERKGSMFFCKVCGLAICTDEEINDV